MNDKSYNHTKLDPYENKTGITEISTEEPNTQTIEDMEVKIELPKLCDFKLKDFTHFDVIF
jgi:hypothetical protein